MQKLGEAELVWGHKLDRKLQEARSVFESRYPYFRAFLWRSVFVEVVDAEDTFTMATDEHLRVYYSKKYVESATPADIAFTIKHEFFHHISSHFKRLDKYKRIFMGPYTLQNIAGDLEIHTKYFNRNEIPPNCITPDSFKMPWGKSAEWYAEELLKKNPVKMVKVISDTGNPGQSQDMVDAPAGTQFKTGEGKEQAPREMGDWERQLLEKKTAEEIEKSRGNIPRDLQLWAQGILHPRVPWDRVLKSVLMHEIGIIEGDTDYSRYPRKTMRSNVLEPNMTSPLANVGVLQDTSGSMWSRKLAIACATETYELVKQVRADVKWYCGDMDVEGKAVIRPGTKPKLKWDGGGGTDMAKAMHTIEKEAKQLDLLVVITDGYTPWPHKKLRFPVVVLIIGGRMEGVPKWVKKTIKYDQGTEDDEY